MNENAKAEAERIWNTLKEAVETLADSISALYASLGSTRKCRHINQLWHPEAPVIGIGFVPPEAKEALEALIVNSGLHLLKGNGPLGHSAYFSFIYDAQLTPARLGKLNEMVAKEAEQFRATPPPPIKQALPAEALMEEQVARMEGLTAVRGEEMRKRPSHVGLLVDAFNSSTLEMSPAKALKLFSEAIPYFSLPEIARNELLHTVKMMHDAEQAS
jgi:hypothetical protein